MEMIKAGYKQTEIGVIPNDWEMKKLKDVSTLITHVTQRNFLTKILSSILFNVSVFSDVPCRNSSFCKNIVWRSENCLSLAEPTSIFRAPTGFLGKNFRIFTEHLIFLVTFFIKEKSDKNQVNNYKN